jgi:cardiolipin synthase (CMP-forming)
VGHPAIVNKKAMPASLPNLITLLRILLVPVTVWLLLNQNYGFAFFAFITAGVSDGIDGYIARRFNLVSDLGTYLDPLADKALLVSIYVSLGALQVVPLWLPMLVVTRDILIVGAVLLAWVMNQPVVMKPIWISKINTVMQIAFAGLLLAGLATGWDFSQLLWPSAATVAFFTLASGGLYMRDWVRHMMATTTGHGPK